MISFNLFHDFWSQGPPLWSGGQCSWLQIQRSWFDSQCYQMFWEVVGLERGPLSLVSTTEELFGRNGSGSGLGNREYGRRDPSRWPCDTLYRRIVGTNFTDKRRSLGRYNALADSGQGVWFCVFQDLYGCIHLFVSGSRRYLSSNKAPQQFGQPYPALYGTLRTGVRL
jgi:hypothetical protein